MNGDSGRLEVDPGLRRERSRSSALPSRAAAPARGAASTEARRATPRRRRAALPARGRDQLGPGDGANGWPRGRRREVGPGGRGGAASDALARQPPRSGARRAGSSFFVARQGSPKERPRGGRDNGSVRDEGGSHGQGRQLRMRRGRARRERRRAGRASVEAHVARTIPTSVGSSPVRTSSGWPRRSRRAAPGQPGHRPGERRLVLRSRSSWREPRRPRATRSASSSPETPCSSFAPRLRRPRTGSGPGRSPSTAGARGRRRADRAVRPVEQGARRCRRWRERRRAGTADEARRAGRLGGDDARLLSAAARRPRRAPTREATRRLREVALGPGEAGRERLVVQQAERRDVAPADPLQRLLAAEPAPLADRGRRGRRRSPAASSSAASVSGVGKRSRSSSPTSGKIAISQNHSKWLGVKVATTTRPVRGEDAHELREGARAVHEVDDEAEDDAVEPAVLEGERLRLRRA